jgi:hypothetical protein
VRELWPRDFRWRQPPYEYEEEKLPIDILAGGTALRLGIDSGTAPWDLCASPRAALARFETETGEFRHYA